MEKGWSDQFWAKETEPKPLYAPALFKKVFFKAAQEFYALTDLDFEVDGGNKNFLAHFCRYWNRDPAFELLENISLRKGIGSEPASKCLGFSLPFSKSEG